MRRRTDVFLMTVAAVLVAGGAFLDWSGVPYSSRVDRNICLVAAVVAVLLAAARVSGRRWPLPAALLPASVTLDMAIVNISDVSGRRYEYLGYPSARVGGGLYLVLGGSAILLTVSVAGVVAGLLHSRRLHVEPDPGA